MGDRKNEIMKTEPEKSGRRRSLVINRSSSSLLLQYIKDYCWKLIAKDHKQLRAANDEWC